MRIVSCPLVVVFVFSLPWRLNSKVTPAINIMRNNEHITEHQMLTHVAEGQTGFSHYSTDAGKENVVSLSSVQTQHLTSESERRISVKTSRAYEVNQRTRRNIDGNGHNLTSLMQTQPEETTLKKELPSSLTPQAILSTTEFTSIHPPTNISSFEKTNSKRVLDTTEKKSQETTEDIPPSTTNEHPNVTDVEGNKTSTNGDLHTPQSTKDTTVQSSPTTPTKDTTVQSSPTTPTKDTTVQSSPTTHNHTFTVRPVIDFNETKSMKTTEKEEIKTERPTGFDVKTSTSKPVEIFTTTLKTTTKSAILAPNNKQGKNPGKTVAAIIGTTFVLMFIAIIYILVRKRKLQKQQLDNPEWAGPSPFLEGDFQPNLPNYEESESVDRQGFGQITKYLPQRLSKHLTFRKDINEEVFMGDILQGSSTFGNHYQEEVQASNGEPTQVKDAPKTEENENQGATSGDSVDSKSPTVTVDIKEPAHQNDNLNATPSQDTLVKTIPPLVSIDLDSLSEETAPSKTFEVGNFPTAPSLP
ncbi:protein EVI2B [Triplophysa dalaica]|uniref:protein EVI2B n=1 Tax=Triplophysa dalaica TaxID=1582913 RepID=UPI0024E039EB|nr:protein EVI2B [Triplophysa dalaica]XP_056613764.1 protein EVI2B [Triplophysa dalaica]